MYKHMTIIYGHTHIYVYIYNIYTSMGMLPGDIFLAFEVEYFKSRLNVYYCNLI